MIEGIAVIRDVVIILAGVTFIVTVAVVGRTVLGLARKVENFRLVAIDIANGVVHPLKGVALAIGRLTGRREKP